MFESIQIPQELLPSDGRFGSGPSLVEPRFVEELNKIQKDYLGTSHRKTEVKNKVGSIFSLLRSYLKVPKEYQIAMGNGGASLVWDMMIFSLIEKESTHFVNGEFSKKCFNAVKEAPFLHAKEIKVESGMLPKFVEDSSSDLHCITWNETSTGAMYSQCPSCEHSLLAVDATSAAGALSWNLEKTDLFYFSPQKAFGSDGGLWLAIFSPNCLTQIERIKKSTRHIPKMLDFTTALENAKLHQSYNTPSLFTIFLLEKQLKVLEEKGIDRVEKEQKEKLKLIEDWVSSREELSFYVENSELRSLSIATINVIEEIPYKDICAALKRHGIRDMECYRKLGKNQLRISFFPNISLENLRKLTKCINYLLNNKKK